MFEENERFHPVISRHGMVASQEALASQVGRDILRRGGNAVDAAVATAFALSVTLPRAGGLGGGGFMLLWLNDKKQALAIDYRETAPKAAHKDMFLKPNGEVDLKLLIDSPLSAGVPGTVAGMTYALKHYGTMSLKEVMQPAIELAQKGFPMTPGLARALQINKKRLARTQAGLQVFYKKEGKEYHIGDRFRQLDLAKSLRRIARSHGRDFYHGRTAKRIVNYMRAHHGIITLDDLKNYRVKITKPIQQKFKGYTIYAMPPPSSGGVSLLQILNILEPLNLYQSGLNSAKTIHLMTEAMNLVYRDRNHYLGDPAFVDIPLKRLLSKAYATKLRNQINRQKHTPAADIAPPYTDNESKQTTHFSIIDAKGNMVANTYTLNYSYGSGLVVPGTGILLNNEMDDFTAKPGIANSFGLVQGKANQIEPNKRPLSSMAPILILDPTGHPWLASGTPGGSRIITTMTQIILNLIVYHLNIATATAMPRMHSQLWPDTLFLEQGLSIDTIRLLEKMGHTIAKVPAMGSVQSVHQFKHHFSGYSDPRRIGALAVGY